MTIASKRHLRIMMGVALTILLTNAHHASAQAPASTLRAIEQELVELVRQVEPSIVSIVTQRRVAMTRNGQTISGWDSAIGSGVVITPAGHILTTANVVDHADEILVSFPDGQQRPGRLVGTDPLSGIAVIHVDSVTVTPARFGNSDTLHPGSWAIMMGNAYGFPSSVSFGLVNGLRPEDGLLQISAVINPGATGGAVFSSGARLIGLIAARLTPSAGFEETGVDRYHFIEAPSSGAVLVIPINRVERFARQLIEYGKVRRSWLGVTIHSMVGANEAVQVDYVYPDSPADEAGLRPGDRVLAVNGFSITNPLALAEYVTTFPVGTIIELRYERQGRETLTYARLLDPPDGIDRSGPSTPEPILTRINPKSSEQDILTQMLNQWLMQFEMQMQQRIKELETQLRQEHEQLRRVKASPSP